MGLLGSIEGTSCASPPDCMLTASQDVAVEPSACFSRRSKTTFPGGSIVLDIVSGSFALLLRNLCKG